MAAGLPDLVDCVRLADETAVLERVYDLGELPRLRDLLDEPRGTVRATFGFAKLANGHAGACVTVAANPVLVCQRCMRGFDVALTGRSEVEFASADAADSAESEREFFRIDNGLASLRELAEEELLLAVPLAPACSTPLTCGKAPDYGIGDEMRDVAGDMRRPFSALQNLLKKT
jgi:uncharacterized protein